MSDARLLTFATDLLDEVGTRLDAAGISVPTTQYVHSGEFAMDFTEENCADALIVTFDGIVQGQSNALPGTAIKCAVPLVAGFTVALIRCVPALTEDGDPPTASELNSSASDLLIDAMELTNAIVDVYLEEGPCSLRSIGSVTPIGPVGAAGGYTVQVFTELA